MLFNTYSLLQCIPDTVVLLFMGPKISKLAFGSDGHCRSIGEQQNADDNLQDEQKEEQTGILCVCVIGMMRENMNVLDFWHRFRRRMKEDEINLANGID